jgi:hypothetical protein
LICPAPFFEKSEYRRIIFTPFPKLSHMHHYCLTNYWLVEHS